MMVVAGVAVLGVLAVAPGASAAAPAFTEVSGSPFTTGAGTFPSSVSFSPQGLLATADFNSPGDDKLPGSVSMFSVAASGVLAQLNGSPFATGARNTAAVAFSPDGRLLAATNLVAPPPLDAPANVTVFSVGPGGALTPVSGSPFAVGGAPVAIAFSPSGRLLAVPNAAGDTVAVFSVGSDGTLTQINGSPFTTGFSPLALAFSPNGRLLAIANGANTVSVLSVASDGGLTQVTGSPFAAGSGPISVAFSPSGRLLAVGNADGTVSLFAVASGGTLTQVKGSPFSSGTGFDEVAFSSTGLLAVVNTGNPGDPPAFDNTLSVYSVGANGALTPVSGSPFPTGMAPDSVATSSSGALIAVANFDDSTVSMYRATGQGANSQGQNNNQGPQH
jgi:6-phosphogluconolactonase (cycloisomerase 2 family)